MNQSPIKLIQSVKNGVFVCYDITESKFNQIKLINQWIGLKMVTAIDNCVFRVLNITESNPNNVNKYYGIE